MSLTLYGRQLIQLGKCCQLLQQKIISQHVGKANTVRIINQRVSFFSTTKHLGTEKRNEKDVDIAVNPFFEKYKSKIQHMQNTNPEEYEQRLKDLSDRLKPKAAAGAGGTSKDGKSAEPPKVVPPSEATRQGVGMTQSKGLDSVMKLDLIKDKTAEEITQIWNQFHSGKDCVYTVLKADDYQNLMEKSKECPVFLYPIPRDDGFEFILAQFDRNDVYFTPLAMFQMVRENAPPCLTLTLFDELLEDKGIVLMQGQYDDKVLPQTLALNLVQQMSIFYGKGSKYYEMVHTFNYQPEQFKYEDLIDALKSLPQFDLK